MIWYAPFRETEGGGDNEAAAENVNRLVVIRPYQTPLARITVIGMVATASSHNEWGVPVIGEGVSEDGFVLTINVEGSDLGFRAELEAECISLMETLGKSR